MTVANRQYTDHLTQHLANAWGAHVVEAKFVLRPAPGMGDFPAPTMLVFRPSPERQMWTYATCGLSDLTQPNPIELHLFSRTDDVQLLELLTIVAHYHRTGARLGLHHTVNLGRPWLPNSACDHGLVSLPYLDGPRVEKMEFGGMEINCLWLIPITRQEREYKMKNGVEALEEKFDKPPLDFANPGRQSRI